ASPRCSEGHAEGGAQNTGGGPRSTSRDHRPPQASKHPRPPTTEGSRIMNPSDYMEATIRTQSRLCDTTKVVGARLRQDMLQAIVVGQALDRSKKALFAG